MKRWFLIITTFTALLLSIQIAHVYAAYPAPLQVTPQNEQTVSSTKLEWLVPNYAVKTTSPYRIQVDDQPDFQNPTKDITTANTFYSPQLAEGIWYWRILAKDLNGVESAWSPTYQFIYSNIIPTLSPSPSIEPSPIITALPTPTPLPITFSPSISPTPTPTASPYFTIGTLPSTINSNESFQFLVSLYLPQYPQTIFYLKGAFYEDGSSNYFGQTKYADNWIKNSQTYSSQYKIQTDSQGKWQGKIECIPDTQDSGFSSSGEYHFKLARYTALGSGPTWSDSQTVYINEIINPSPSPSPTISPVPSPSIKEATTESLLYKSQIQPVILDESTPSATEASASALDIVPNIASIAGIATVAGDIATRPPSNSPSKINPGWFYFSSGILFLIGIASAFIVKYKPDWNIKKWLFSPNQLQTPKNSPPLWQRDLPPTEEWWR